MIFFTPRMNDFNLFFTCYLPDWIGLLHRYLLCDVLRLIHIGSGNGRIAARQIVLITLFLLFVCPRFISHWQKNFYWTVIQLLITKTKRIRFHIQWLLRHKESVPRMFLLRRHAAKPLNSYSCPASFAGAGSYMNQASHIKIRMVGLLLHLFCSMLIVNGNVT